MPGGVPTPQLGFSDFRFSLDKNEAGRAHCPKFQYFSPSPGLGD
jgi:hypothetical protein